ncbi:MAG: aminopeptidase P family protein [Acidobacteriota bacterium]
MKEKIERYDWADIYRQRRNRIREKTGDGLILWLGQIPQPINYEGNTYPFRQNSHFLYYTGLSVPRLAMLSFPDRDRDILFADPTDEDAIVWSGPGPTTVELARQAGIETVEEFGKLADRLAKAEKQGMRIHYLPPYRTASMCLLSQLLKISPDEVAANISQLLMQEVAAQRSVKSGEEIDQIEEALSITDRMHRVCMAVARPDVRERELAALIQAIALAEDRQQAYQPIVTVHGEVLHNNSYDGILKEGQLLLNDSGVESAMYYASDITRTFPVSGRFADQQAEIYQVVLNVQRGAIEKIRPGVTNREIHLAASKLLVEGLCGVGLMRGNADDAVEAGAHALFFPHGIGHMLGLDVHDMEDLGDIVGYREKEPRSGQFGLKYLRLSRPLEPGFVLTVDPGIYFIPALIDRWKSEKKHEKFIHYEAVEIFRNFGGIRIEDNVLVTKQGVRILGPKIPIEISEIEEACGFSLQGSWPPAIS